MHPFIRRQLHVPHNPPVRLLVVQLHVSDERLVVAAERRLCGHHVRGRRVSVPAHRTTGDPRRLCGAQYEGGPVNACARLCACVSIIDKNAIRCIRCIFDSMYIIYLLNATN